MKVKIMRSDLLAVALVALTVGVMGCGPKEKPVSEGAAETLQQEKPGTEQDVEGKEYRAIAYVTVPASENWRWIGTDGDVPVSEVDTRYVTHINYAFGMIQAYQFEPGKPGCPKKDGSVVSKEAYKDPADGKYHYRAVVDGWIEEMDTTVDGGKYLKALVDLKREKPELKVLLSIGGWDSDGFCYMASDSQGRMEFIDSCIALIHEYGLDGIDLDWEYPTNGGWGEIASCPDCVTDAGTLLKEFRSRLNEEFPDSVKLLTIASGGSQPWVDQDTLNALDYINVMCYDYDPGSGGDMAGLETASGMMDGHAAMAGGTPETKEKINLGIPFYNEGGEFLVPYYKGYDGHIDADRDITETKMNWVREMGYGGAFYWAYSMDTFEQDVDDPLDPEIKILQRTVYETLNGKPLEQLKE